MSPFPGDPIRHQLEQSLLRDVRRHPITWARAISGSAPYGEFVWLGGDLYQRRSTLSRREYLKAVARMRRWARPRLQRPRQWREAEAVWRWAADYSREYESACPHWAPGLRFGEAMALAIEDALAFFDLPLDRPDILAALRHGPSAPMVGPR